MYIKNIHMCRTDKLLVLMEGVVPERRHNGQLSNCNFSSVDQHEQVSAPLYSGQQLGRLNLQRTFRVILSNRKKNIVWFSCFSRSGGLAVALRGLNKTARTLQKFTQTICRCKLNLYISRRDVVNEKCHIHLVFS